MLCPYTVSLITLFIHCTNACEFSICYQCTHSTTAIPLLAQLRMVFTAHHIMQSLLAGIPPDHHSTPAPTSQAATNAVSAPPVYKVRSKHVQGTNSLLRHGTARHPVEHWQCTHSDLYSVNMQGSGQFGKQQDKNATSASQSSTVTKFKVQTQQ